MALPTERPRLLGLRSHGHGCPLLLERACGSLHLGNVEGKRLPLKTLWGQVENQMEQSLRGALGSPRLLHPQGAGQPEHGAEWLPGLASLGPNTHPNQEGLCRLRGREGCS